MVDFVIAGVPAGIVVVVLVEGVKRVFKLEGDRVIPIAVLVGILAAAANQAAELWPAFGVWWETAIAGALLGFAACGLFDLSQAVRSKSL